MSDINTAAGKRSASLGDILLLPLTILLLLCGLLVGYLYASFNNGFKWGFRLMMDKTDEVE